MDSLYYLLHTIELRHRQPLTYQQLKNLLAHSLSNMSEEVFDNQYAELLAEGLIREKETISLTFRGEVTLNQHRLKQQFNLSD